jgi:hypothetical protein
VIALLLLACAAAPAQEPASEPALPLAFVEIEPAEAEAWDGQSEVITIRFGIEDELAENRLISVFRRPLDLPVRLDTQVWHAEASIRVAPLRGEPADGPSFAWDGDLAYARESTQDREGRRYRVYEVRAWVEHRSGPSGVQRATERLHAEPARLHLAYATAFETDFLGDRVPVSEQRLTIASPPLRRTVRALPQAGLLVAQSSGVFREAKLTATISPSEVELGEEFQIDVRVDGPWDMPNVDLIHPAEIGWTLLGELELESDDRLARVFATEPAVRRYRFDGRATQAGVIEFVPFRLVRFDPDLGEYQQDASGRLSLTVRGAAVGTGAAAGNQTSADPSETAQPAQPEAPVASPEAGSTGRLPIWTPWLLGAGLLALAAWGRQTMRQSVRRREAEVAVGADRASASNGREPLETWLAAQLGWTRAQLVDPALRARLQAVGVPAELAAATADFLQAAEAARYGGPATQDSGQGTPGDAATTREELRRRWIAHAKTQVQRSP